MISKCCVTIIAFLATLSEAKVRDIEEYNNQIFGAMLLGRSPVVGKTLIVGGEETMFGQYPFAVGLRSCRGCINECGGSLIDRTHVLTAAHCIKPFRQWVSVGSHFYSGTVDGQQIKIESIRKHPDYNYSIGMKYDFAILTLDEPVRDEFASIVLSAGADEEVGQNATVAGWGTIKRGGAQSEVMLEVQVPIITNEICNQNVTDIHSSMVCAGGDAKDACQGDSGGPMFTFNDNGRPTLVGVVSWGIGCAQANLPGVYARVSTVQAWIKFNTDASEWSESGSSMSSNNNWDSDF